RVAAMPHVQAVSAVRLDEYAVALVDVVQLAVAARALVAGAAGVATVGALEDRVALLFRVGGQEDLVGLAARQPRPVAVVAVGGAGIPGLAAVLGREQRICRQVDAGVVD